MIKLVHPVAGAIAFFTIASFWFSTVYSELFGTKALVICVKTTIPWGFLVLIPALVITGATGFKRSRGMRKGLLGTKVKRMPIIAANGVLILIPAAFFLSYRAQSADFDTVFYSVQVLELLAGLINLILLGMNMRDGLKITGRLRNRSL